MFLLHPPRLKKALYFLDTDQSGEIDKEDVGMPRRGMNPDARRDEALRGLAKRLERLAAERSGASARRRRPTPSSATSSSTRRADASR